MFVSLTAGSYTLRVELTGFKPVERTNFVLDAASRRSADFQLEVGSITETISIAAITSQVETQSGDVEPRDHRRAGEQHRAERPQLRAAPAAAARRRRDQSTNPFGIGLNTTGQAINGVRSPSTYFMVDGADNMDNGANGNAITQPSLDTISEIKVLTASYSAEFGGRAGALINVVTKGGTREFKGSAYEFLRDEKFDARRSSIRASRRRSPSTTRATPSAARSRSAASTPTARSCSSSSARTGRRTIKASTQVTTVPTVAERNGDFRNSSLAAPRDPLTGQPFADRTIPSSRFSANGPALLSAYPAPNFAGPGGNYVATGTNQTDSREEVVRIDYVHSSRTQISYRYTHNGVDSLQSLPGRQHRHRPRHPPASGMDDRRQHAADAVEHAAELGRRSRGRRTRFRRVRTTRRSRALRAAPDVSGDLRVEPLRHRPRRHPHRLHRLQRRRLHQEPELDDPGPRRSQQGDGRARVQVRHADHLQPEGSEHASARERRRHVRDQRAQQHGQCGRRCAAGELPELHGRRDRSGVAGALLAVPVLRAGQLARLAEADARLGAALQHHRAALQRVEQLLDVRSGPLRSVAGADRARERRVARPGHRQSRPTASSSSATASRTRRTA